MGVHDESAPRGLAAAGAGDVPGGDRVHGARCHLFSFNLCHQRCDCGTEAMKPS